MATYEALKKLLDQAPGTPGASKGSASKSATIAIDVAGRVATLSDQNIVIPESQVTGLTGDLATLAGEITALQSGKLDLGTHTPLGDSGTGVVGTATEGAREDHQHPAPFLDFFIVPFNANAYSSTDADNNLVGCAVVGSSGDQTITLQVPAGNRKCIRSFQKTDTGTSAFIVQDTGAAIIGIARIAGETIIARYDGTAWSLYIDTSLARRLGTTLPASARAGFAVPFYVTRKFQPLAGMVDEFGIPHFFQIDTSAANYFETFPNFTTSNPTAQGGSILTTGTLSSPVFAAGSRKGECHRTVFACGASQNTGVGLRAGNNLWNVRGQSAGHGGFYERYLFDLELDQNGGQMLVGFQVGNSVLNGNPQSLLNCCGVGFQSSDPSTGNMFLMHNDGSGQATHDDLGTGALRSAGNLLQLEIGCAPNDSGLWVRVWNIETQAVVLDWEQLTTDIPDGATTHCPVALVRNAGAASDMQIACAKMMVRGQIGVRV